MAGEEWEPFKPEIERLYCYENKTLRQVKDYMASMYDFDKSPSQYQRQLAKWGLSKNQTRVADWEFIGRRTEKRKRNDEKESEVHIGGIQLRPQKIRKAKYREAFVSTMDIYIANSLQAPSPATPEGVVVCTPVSPGMRLKWNASLPWLRFISLLRPEMSQDAPSPSSSLTVPSPRELDVPSHTASRELMRRLASIVPWNRLNSPQNIYSSSRTAAALMILMPEKSEGEHLELSSNLSDSKQNGRDRLTLELFLLSNNLVSHAPGGRSEDSMLYDDERVMETFNESGWNNVKHLQMLLSTHEPTAGAIAEKLFASAIRLVDVDTVKMMLEAGMDVNATVDTIRHGPLSSLQFASAISDNEGLELMQLLLSYGANVNLSHNEHSALGLAIDERNDEITRVLLDHGAIVTPSCLSAIATYRTIDNLVRDVINACPNVNERTGWQDPSALTRAVSHRNVAMIVLLLARGAEINELVDIDFDNDLAVTTVLGIAVKSGLRVVQSLLCACRNVNPKFDDFPYVSPLALAVETGNTEITWTLLQAGVDVEVADGQGNMTLLERATKKKNPSLWRVLIEYGAQLDRPSSDTKRASSAILVAIMEKQSDLVELLIKVGARLNDEYSQPPGTVLGAAIEIGDTLLIDKLLAAGARVLKGQLRRIGNLHTAMYLQQRTVLQRILQTSGPEILAAALLARDDDFCQYLLEYDADLAKGLTDSQDSRWAKTPLGAAIQTRNFVFAETLLSRGAKVTEGDLADAMNYCGDNTEFLQRLLPGFRGSAPTAVGVAVLNNMKCLEVLREANVDPTGAPQLFQDTWDLDDFDLEPPQSALEIAVVMGKEAMGKEALGFLLQWTAWDPRLTGRALVIAIGLNEHDLVDSLLTCGPDLRQEVAIRYMYYEDEDSETRNEQYEIFTPLQAAVKEQLVPVAKFLAKSVDVDYLGDGARRRTPLQHAVEKGNMELIKMLLQHGARVDGPPARDGGATALQIAAFQGYVGIARRLIDLGADINEAPARFNGRTALQGAAEHGRIDLLQMLLDEGALIVGDGEQQYQRAVELAEQNGHKAAARLLRSFRSLVQLSTP
ncbi:uncharacterized protein ASPGLDRAFT_129119 [Aspergillus glaucus CBS 516.65]|uniref:Clr5 domain-containing protein n=1 Tax=Aspergillus glaucus CBS 516.65 TaxID=1160497 RepID=A0A1L9VGA4_ASPGL|nr:hypothetical protein ASPGLDRAFT_129119 [Aspergillus glaucus CBS 516.65]OJJ82971.1 hypothetical protein ASPGLDRAFT_129119 [Aspergillus glaucus CBS 516.65]